MLKPPSPTRPTVSLAVHFGLAVASAAPSERPGLHRGLGDGERERRLARAGRPGDHDVLAGRERGDDGRVDRVGQLQPDALGGGPDGRDVEEAAGRACRGGRGGAAPRASSARHFGLHLRREPLPPLPPAPPRAPRPRRRRLPRAGAAATIADRNLLGRRLVVLSGGPSGAGLAGARRRLGEAGGERRRRSAVGDVRLVLGIDGRLLGIASRRGRPRRPQPPPRRRAPGRDVVAGSSASSARQPRRPAAAHRPPARRRPRRRAQPPAPRRRRPARRRRPRGRPTRLPVPRQRPARWASGIAGGDAPPASGSPEVIAGGGDGLAPPAPVPRPPPLPQPARRAAAPTPLDRGRRGLLGADRGVRAGGLVGRGGLPDVRGRDGAAAGLGAAAAWAAAPATSSYSPVSIAGGAPRLVRLGLGLGLDGGGLLGLGLRLGRGALGGPLGLALGLGRLEAARVELAREVAQRHVDGQRQLATSSASRSR